MIEGIKVHDLVRVPRSSRGRLDPNHKKRKKNLILALVLMIAPKLFSRNISNTRKNVSSDFQTPRSRLEKRGADECFYPTSRCLKIGGNTLSSV